MNAIELAGQLCMVTGACDADYAILQQSTDELRRLHAENESLRKDAGRYQWLKENGYHVDDDEFMPHIEYGLFVHADRSIKSIDEAIDAAMGEVK